MEQGDGNFGSLGALGSGKTSYEEWRDEQGVPVVTGFYIEDLNEVELAPWAWKGGRGAILNLEGTDDLNDSYICEIAPGGKLSPMKHIYDEMVYILKGRGATRIWQDGQEPITFEWQAGSLFAIPINANYQHFNGSGTEPARYIAVTFAPLLINLFRDRDFIFHSKHAFLDRFNGQDGYFDGTGRALKQRIWDTNFIADVNHLPLMEWDARGKGSTNRRMELGGSSMGTHISQFEVGKYKKGHRHGPGAHVIIIGGEGYSLMWPEGSDLQRFDWKAGSLVVPPDQWFHQHFNLGRTPAKYLAIKTSGRKYRWLKQYGTDEDVRSGGSQIEHDQEDPRIRELFEAELAKRSLTSMMGDVYSK